MIHIAPGECALGLLAGVGRHLSEGGVFALYGPFQIAGKHTAPSNEAFHASLQSRDPSWGVRNLDDIIAASDIIMVARGDLGIEVHIEELPIIQRRIVKRCLCLGRRVIVATHLLESMIENPRPTRAEASDCANAVLDTSPMASAGIRNRGAFMSMSPSLLSFRGPGSSPRGDEFTTRRRSHYRQSVVLLRAE